MIALKVFKIPNSPAPPNLMQFQVFGASSRSFGSNLPSRKDPDMPKSQNSDYYSGLFECSLKSFYKGSKAAAMRVQCRGLWVYIILY